MRAASSPPAAATSGVTSESAAKRQLPSQTCNSRSMATSAAIPSEISSPIGCESSPSTSAWYSSGSVVDCSTRLMSCVTAPRSRPPMATEMSIRRETAWRSMTGRRRCDAHVGDLTEMDMPAGGRLDQEVADGA